MTTHRSIHRFLTIFIIGLFSTLASKSQSLVGKWKVASQKGNLIYKVDGRKVDVTKDQSSLIFEFHADHTYIQTSLGKPGQRPGTYTFVGDLLTMKIDTKGFTAEQKAAIEKRPQISTVKFISANSMTWHSMLDDDLYKSDVLMTLNRLE